MVEFKTYNIRFAAFHTGMSRQVCEDFRLLFPFDLAVPSPRFANVVVVVLRIVLAEFKPGAVAATPMPDTFGPASEGKLLQRFVLSTGGTSPGVHALPRLSSGCVVLPASSAAQ
jgi:hypothetical protein